jgi:hypothetical protein
MAAFPRRWAYADKCSNKDCQGGTLLDGHAVCPNCHGSGKEPVHSGVKDVITLSLPRNPADMIDLNQLYAEKGADVGTLTFMDDFVDKYASLVFKRMFNNEVATRSDIATAATATEVNFGTDNMNDTLYPFARHYSSLWQFVVHDIATFTDLGEGLVTHHKFPSDFKMKGIVELMGELKAANDAGAPHSVIAAILDDINNILYSDRPDDLRKIKVKSMLNPFRGYPEATVRLLISQGLTTEYNATLWANLESIFNELEIETPDIYSMTLQKIKENLKVKTQEYIDQMKSEIPAEPPTF